MGPQSTNIIPPPVTQGNASQPRTFNCTRQGCKRRGCMQRLRRMCKQCCIALPGCQCNLRAHSYLLGRKQNYRNPYSTSGFRIPLDPSLRTISYQGPRPSNLYPSRFFGAFDGGEKRQYEAALLASLHPMATDYSTNLLTYVLLPLPLFCIFYFCCSRTCGLILIVALR